MLEPKAIVCRGAGKLANSLSILGLRSSHIQSTYARPTGLSPYSMRRRVPLL